MAASNHYPCLVVAEGLHEGASVTLARRSLYIGSDEHCDLILRDPGVETLHAVISRERHGLELKPAPHTECWVDDLPVDMPKFLLYDGARIRIGEALLVFDRTGTSAPTPPALAAATRPVVRTAAGVLARTAAVGAVMAFGSAAFLFALESLHPAAMAKSTESSVVPSAAAMRERLRQLQLADLRVAQQPGRAPVIEGFVEDETQAQRVREDPVLRTLRPWAARFNVGRAVADSVAQLIGAANVQARYQPGKRIVLSGTVEDARLQTRVRRIIKEMGAEVEIVDAIAYRVSEAESSDTKSKAASQKLRVSMVGTGNPRYIETAEGKRYFEGSRLGDGSELVAISESSLTLKRDGKTTQMALPPRAASPEEPGAEIVEQQPLRR
jgi:hypothetical protein